MTYTLVIVGNADSSSDAAREAAEADVRRQAESAIHNLPNVTNATLETMSGTIDLMPQATPAEQTPGENAGTPDNAEEDEFGA